MRYLRTKIVLELTKEFSGTIFSLHFWVVMPEVEKLSGKRAWAPKLVSSISRPRGER